MATVSINGTGLKAEGYVILELKDKDTNRILNKVEKKNMITDGVFTVFTQVLSSGDSTVFHVFLSLSETETVGTRVPPLIIVRTGTSRYNNPTPQPDQEHIFSFRIYAQFSPPSSDRIIKSVGLTEGQNCFAHTVLTTPIIQTPNDYLDVHYTIRFKGKEV